MAKAIKRPGFTYNEIYTLRLGVARLIRDKAAGYGTYVEFENWLLWNADDEISALHKLNQVKRR